MELNATDALPRMLTRLKLTAIRDQLDSLLDEVSRQDVTFRESLALLCEREIARKDERRIEMGLSIAKFPFVRELSGFDFAAQPSLDPKQVPEPLKPWTSWVLDGKEDELCPTLHGQEEGARCAWPARRSGAATRSCSIYSCARPPGRSRAGLGLHGAGNARFCEYANIP